MSKYADTSELRFGSVQNLYLELETRPLTEPFRSHTAIKFGNRFKNWDHLTFAFVIPDNCKGIQFSPDITINMLVKGMTIQEASTTDLTPDKNLKKQRPALVNWPGGY